MIRFFSIFLFLCAAFPGSSLENAIQFEEIKSLPVQHEGRLKPLDTVARNALLILHGNQKIYDGNRRMEPIEWMLDMLMDPQKAKDYPVFRIDHPDIASMMKPDEKYFSYSQLMPHLEAVHHQAAQAANLPENERDSYQLAMMQLWKKISLYYQINHTLTMSDAGNVIDELLQFEIQASHWKRTDDPSDLQSYLERYLSLSEIAHFEVLENDSRWMNMGEGLLVSLKQPSLHYGVYPIAKSIDAYRKKDFTSFNQSMKGYISAIKNQRPEIFGKISYEVLLNGIQPFSIALLFYLLAFFFAMSARFGIAGNLALYCLIAGFFLHSFGLFSRMYIEGRPPVTNLYSSAIFVGWASVLISFGMERFRRNDLAIAAAASISSLSLVIAQHLAGKGETMEMMRAVLNSNFWLSTHVVTITIGYSSTFLAGFLGIFGILRHFFLNSDESALAKKVYGIVCFSTLFSFIGTVLGGIWADQSWGRFWGWDPKENGALMIVLWNAMILHARWGGLVRTQGLFRMAVFGNVITAFSWFGVNMLGVGLHSYGFTEHAFFWLALFMLSQILIICFGFCTESRRQS